MTDRQAAYEIAVQALREMLAFGPSNWWPLDCDGEEKIIVDKAKSALAAIEQAKKGYL